jgi:hypothetical protein
VYEKVKKDNPECKITELTKIIAEKWSHLDGKAKKKYEDLQTESKKRYEKEKKDYEDKYGKIEKK